MTDTDTWIGIEPSWDVSMRFSWEIFSWYIWGSYLKKYATFDFLLFSLDRKDGYFENLSTLWIRVSKRLVPLAAETAHNMYY